MAGVSPEPTNPYAPPLNDATTTASKLAPTLDGSRLRFGKGAELPKVCVGCGTKTRVRYKSQDFEYVPAVVWLTIPFIGVLAAFLLRSTSRRARVRVPRCKSCERREASIAVLRGPAAIGIVVLLLIAATLAGNGLPIAGAIVALLTVLVGIVTFRRWLGGGIRATHIDEHTVTLHGIHPAALVAITTSHPPAASAN
jgi:hypothetical protein